MMDPIPFHIVIARSIDVLRKQMLDDGSIGQYLLALVMVNYTSDLTSVSRARTSGSFVIADNARFDHLLQHAMQPGNAGRIEDALLQVEKTNAVLVSDDLCGALFSHRDRDSSHEVNCALGDVIKLFSCGESLAALRAKKTDLIEPILELLASSAHRRGGQFYTPGAITALITDILRPNSGESVYDPVCGPGGFFVSALNHVRRDNASGSLQLLGQERSVTAARIAALNLRLHDIDKASVYIGDALMEPGGAGFNIAVSNPPFSETRTDLNCSLRGALDRFAPGVPPPGRADYAYILRMLASLKRDTGRMAVVMPTGALFRGGSEREIRKNLIERNLLDTVIALPPKMFTGTPISTVVMIFRRDRNDESVLFIDASENFEPGRRRNVLRAEHVKQIVDAFHQRSEIRQYARLVSRAEIETNNFNLSVSRYINRAAPLEATDPGELSARENMVRAELEDIQRQIESCLDELHLRKE